MADHEQGEPALTLDTVGGLTITQAAALLKVHPNTVRKQVKRGELPSQRVLTPQGLIYVIPREALGLPESEPVNLGLTDLQPASSPTTGLTSLVSELWRHGQNASACRPPSSARLRNWDGSVPCVRWLRSAPLRSSAPCAGSNAPGGCGCSASGRQRPRPGRSPGSGLDTPRCKRDSAHRARLSGPASRKPELPTV